MQRTAPSYECELLHTRREKEAASDTTAWSNITAWINNANNFGITYGQPFRVSLVQAIVTNVPKALSRGRPSARYYKVFTKRASRPRCLCVHVGSNVGLLACSKRCGYEHKRLHGCAWVGGAGWYVSPEGGEAGYSWKLMLLLLVLLHYSCHVFCQKPFLLVSLEETFFLDRSGKHVCVYK